MHMACMALGMALPLSLTCSPPPPAGSPLAGRQASRPARSSPSSYDMTCLHVSITRPFIMSCEPSSSAGPQAKNMLSPGLDSDPERPSGSVSERESLSDLSVQIQLGCHPSGHPLPHCTPHRTHSPSWHAIPEIIMSLSFIRLCAAHCILNRGWPTGPKVG